MTIHVFSEACYAGKRRNSKPEYLPIIEYRRSGGAVYDRTALNGLRRESHKAAVHAAMRELHICAPQHAEMAIIESAVA